jgi:uncharacterized protein (TIGR02231 family)
MKRASIIMLFCFLAITSLHAQQSPGSDEITAVSSIEKVTVYADRAVVERKADLEFKAGQSYIVFDNLPERIDPSSLQLKGRGAVVVEDLVFRSKYFAAIPDERIKALQASRDESEAKITAVQDKIARSNSEKQFLEKIAAKVTATAEEGTSELNPDKWSQMVKFYREKLSALDLEIRASERDQKAERAELARIDQELSRLSAGRQKKKNQALAVLSAQASAKASVTLSYTVAGPSWKPAYDLRVDSEKKTLQLSYNATISQNTGEDWSGVSLSLSTARAEVGGAQPELDPWYLYVYSLSKDRSRASGASAKKAEAPPAPAQMMEAAESKAVVNFFADAEIVDRVAAAQTGATSVVFNVPGKTKIDSDALQHRVNVTSVNLPAYFRYSTAPRLSMYAYLKARMKNESDFPFLAGPAKVFLDGAFVSDSNLAAVAPGEEFWVFLGVDEAVKVEYKLVKKLKDEQGVFEKKTRYVYQYETTLSNKKKSDVELVLWDQLPISQDKNVVVKLLDPKYSKDSESLKKSNQDIFEWLIPLKAGESRKVAFSYSVEYPQDMALGGLE